MIHRITDAVMRSLDESFDIEDMDHVIVADDTRKHKVEKFSKQYVKLKTMLPMFPFDAKSFNALSKDDRMFIAGLLECDDDDVRDLIRREGLKYDIKKAVEWVYVEEMVARLMDCAITVEDQEFYEDRLSGIITEDDLMCGCYPVSGRFELRKIIFGTMCYFGKDVNLNWLDVSKVTGMQQMFSEHNVWYDEMGEDEAIHYDMETIYDTCDINYDDEDDLVNDYNKYQQRIRGMWHSGLNESFNGDISLWDVSNVKSMEGMFALCNFDGDISSWNVSNVLNMSNMFFQSEFRGDISNWNVSKVTNMSCMFADTSFNPDISGWDVGNVQYMYAMFYRNNGFDRDISEWNISQVYGIDQMFSHSIFNQDIGKWDVSDVRTMYGMFEYSKFDRNIADWKIRDMSHCAGGMFWEAEIKEENVPKVLLKRYTYNELIGADEDDDENEQ